MRYFGAFESCALFLYKLKVVLFFFTNGKHQLHKLSDTHTHTHAHAHTHIRTHERVFPCFRFNLGSRIRLHIGSPRRASERIGRREEARGTMWERDC